MHPTFDDITFHGISQFKDRTTISKLYIRGNSTSTFSLCPDSSTPKGVVFGYFLQPHISQWLVPSNNLLNWMGSALRIALSLSAYTLFVHTTTATSSYSVCNDLIIIN